MKVARYNGKDKWHIVEWTAHGGIPVTACGRRMVNGWNHDTQSAVPCVPVPIRADHDLCKACVKRVGQSAVRAAIYGGPKREVKA